MNKKLNALLFAMVLAIGACESVPQNEFLLNGETDLPEGTTVYRVIAGANNQPTYADTTQVEKGKFTFSGDAREADVNFIFIDGETQNAAFILEEGKIEIEIFKDSIDKAVLKGTPSNLDLMRYKTDTKGFADALNGIVKDIQQANSVGDNILVEDLQAQYKEMQEKLNNYEMSYVKENVDSYVSSLILERFISQKLITQSEAKPLFSNFTARIRTSRSGKNVLALLSRPYNATAIGEIAPDFTAPNPEGQMLSLNALKGKVTIIDFWASWCRPCRIENPNLVRLYKRMHDKGLEVVGVSLDKNRASWLRAIEDDGLIWNHVSNLQYWQDPVAKLYSVRGIPAAFVLDKDGKIVAKNLRGRQLDAKIEELLAD